MRLARKQTLVNKLFNYLTHILAHMRGLRNYYNTPRWQPFHMPTTLDRTRAKLAGRDLRISGYPAHRLLAKSCVDIKLCAFIRKLSVLGLLLFESLKANRWLTWPKREPIGL